MALVAKVTFLTSEKGCDVGAIVRGMRDGCQVGISVGLDCGEVQFSCVDHIVYLCVGDGRVVTKDDVLQVGE